MLAPGMALRFAPVSVPLERRIQTVAVLQWIFSFLLLGNSLPPPALPQEEGERRGEEGVSFCAPSPGHRAASGLLLGSGSSPGRGLWMLFLLWVSFFPWDPVEIPSRNASDSTSAGCPLGF